MNCLECGVATINPKFCSRSCAATHNNRLVPKRVKTLMCAKDGCETLVYSRLKFCKRHSRTNIQEFTIGEMRSSARYQVHAAARQMARKYAKEELDTSKCWACGYDKHIEVCHVRDLKDFPSDTKMVDTYTNNVVVLCRNHHWEFDHGFLIYVDGKFESSDSITDSATAS